ncbi:MAG: HAMP domain-containing histidine kinase [Aureispira sp.]|nr:HAMP domain-containing histidine kinase [Aureispira sp.]
MLVVITATFYYILNNLKEQNRLVTIKNDLISNITHELRTPIFTVSAALEALESFNGLENPERTKEYLTISKNELNRLSILVEKVLKTSLFEQDALEINYEVFLIAPLLQTISNSLKLQLEQENASLEILSLDHIQVRADKIHLTNVVYNLIDNALKYKANRPTQIRINVLDTKTQTQIIVSDNGIGIPSNYIDQVFKKFFRVPQGNQHNVKGYGLGLNYVSNIIQQHKGNVRVESEEGKGSQFTISLPKHSKT